jgi:hypothetical protein
MCVRFGVRGLYVEEKRRSNTCSVHIVGILAVVRKGEVVSLMLSVKLLICTFLKWYLNSS